LPGSARAAYELAISLKMFALDVATLFCFELASHAPAERNATVRGPH
jgi:hypothetical protein